MKKLTLTPDQILATDDSVPDCDQLFKTYHRVFAGGEGESLPPIIVGTIKSPSEWIRRLQDGYSRWEQKHSDILRMRRKEYQILFSMLRKIPYYILDGNHRALAAALNRRALKVLQIDSDQDLAEIERMISGGQLLSFPHEGQSVEALEGEFIRHFLNLSDVPPNHNLNATNVVEVVRLVPVATRAYDLVTSNKVPRYMVKNYSARKESRPRILPTPPIKWR